MHWDRFSDPGRPWLAPWGGAISAGSGSARCPCTINREPQGAADDLPTQNAYQACVRVQWGQPTEVVTSASKAYPHSHV